jgi:amidase
MVVEMPWRQAEEDFIHKQSKSSGLCFGVMKSDGVALAQPPVTRAIDMVVSALEKEGHKVIEWKPTPTHEELSSWIFKSFGFDGGKDLQGAFGLSGEDVAKQVLLPPDAKEFTGTDIAAVNVEQRAAKKKYMDYWNSTAELTGTGRPVDAVISPVAPYAAARPEGYKYYNFTVWVNGLDYTSAVVPVTIADKSRDKYPEGYKPISEADKVVVEDYDAEIYDGAHVSIQLVGRRFQEERMLAAAEYVGSLLGR